MAKKGTTTATRAANTAPTPSPRGRPSVLLDTRVVYCEDCLEQLQSLPDACVDHQAADAVGIAGRGARAEDMRKGRKRLVESRFVATRQFEADSCPDVLDTLYGGRRSY